MSTTKIFIPLDGIKGLKQNFTADLNAGFIVFLLALPLSLGIAKASEFPAIMGLVTAIIGGLFAGLISGSPLTIKGPAAGLIVILVGAVTDFGGGQNGWHLACGAIAIASVLQIIFGLAKLGKYTDVFPLSSIHGMLAAIGIIIILKQIPILLGENPIMMKGMTPFDLIKNLPIFLSNFDARASIIGIVSLLIMLFWSSLKIPLLSKIPAHLVVILIAIPAELWMDFSHTEPEFTLLHIGDFKSAIRWNADFSGIAKTGVFIKYVVMFALVGSLESLLTVKAIDMIDPYKRKSNPNKDLIAIGVGNLIAGLLGGLPMISEVARSSANFNSGAKTRWANVFHGMFILLFVLFASQFLELIPNCALAAMLISVGIKLAHPKEFAHVYHIGKDQLAIFLVTIFFTLYEDLLVGIFAGIILKMIFHRMNGVPLKNFFTTPVSVSFNDGPYLLKLEGSAVFTNYLRLKDKMDAIPPHQKVTIDATEVKLIDHNTLAAIEQFKKEYTADGGSFDIVGLDKLKPLSGHNLATRKLK
ncbi:MAG: SulP family inorganic anion transporter [Chitinophagales bacterium]